MSTILQRRAFKELLIALEREPKTTFRDIMLKAGFSDYSSRNPKDNLIERTGFQELLQQIDDKLLLGKLYQFLLDDSDKRVALAAIQELFKLKDAYPVPRSKIDLGLEQRREFVESEAEEAEEPTKQKPQPLCPPTSEQGISKTTSDADKG